MVTTDDPGPDSRPDTAPDSGVRQPAPDLLDHPAVARVRARLAALGATGAVVVLPDHARTAAAAAQQLGVGIGQIASSLVFSTPDGAEAGGRRPVLVMTSGAHRVDVARVAALLGVGGLDRADPDFVRATTGFAIGGVAPVGHPEPMLTAVDVSLAAHDVVWAAAGHPRTVFPTRYDELLRITAGQPVEVD